MTGHPASLTQNMLKHLSHFPLSPCQSFLPLLELAMLLLRWPNPTLKDDLRIIHPRSQGSQLGPQLQVEVTGEYNAGRVNKTGRQKGTWHFQTIAIIYWTQSQVLGMN